MLLSLSLVQKALFEVLAAAGVLLGSLSAIGLFYVASSWWKARTSALAILPGPKPDSWIRGNYDKVEEFNSDRLREGWLSKYGRTIVTHSILGAPKLVTLDLKALQHIFGRPDIYQRRPEVRVSIGFFFGKGILFAEGDQHRRQRRILNPAFGPSHVNKLTGTFVSKAVELRDIWLEKASHSQREDGRLRVDVYPWLSKATLDIIGLTGFGYNFDTLHAPEDNPNRLYEAFQRLSGDGRSLALALQGFVPALGRLPFGPAHRRRQRMAVVHELSAEIVADRKAAVLAEANGDVKKDAFPANDLLSLLIKSNLASDVPERMRMSDEELQGQIPTFLFAGHETTSTSVSWALFSLSCHMDIQKKLRAELLACPTDDPSADKINGMLLLDGVVREVLRLHAPVARTDRAAITDDVIPFGQAFVDKNGVTRTELRVSKGDGISIPNRILNRSVEIWGDDAEEFRPERWTKPVPEAAHSMPGIWSNILTFAAGSHACIGFKFSLVETKAILFVLLRAFEFELAIQPDDIIRRFGIGKPTVDDGTNDTRPQLPLVIRPVKRD